MAAYALLGIFVMVYVMESYVIRCPEQAEWNIRAEIQCQNITKYFCLYNYIRYTYEEGCTGPEWEIPGSKRVYSRNFNSAPCNDTHYQPILFVTNGNSDCIFRKSLCTEEGQTLFTNGTTRTDSSCRCDYKQGYAFVTVPRNKCFCRPSEEDCSCYLKKCQEIGYYLSADYECTKNGRQKTVCSLMSENPSEDPHINMAPTGTPREYDSYAIKRTYDVAIIVSICLFVMNVSAVITTCCIMLLQRLARSRRLSTEQDGIILKETVSGNNKDNQITLREDDKKWKYALKELTVNIKKEGQGAALKQFKEDLENWRNELVKLAVIGKSGVGKSSFINAIRNLKSGDPGFATTSSSGNTTKHATVYEYPGNPNITLHDLPGFGTTKYFENEYKEIMELSKYDCFLLFVRNIERNDIEIAKILKEIKKPFCFVRSKLDFDFQNAKNDGDSEADVIENIMANSLDILTTTGFKEAKFFIISNCNRSIGHFNELVLYIQSNLPKLKCNVVKLYMCGELSDDIIDSKYKLLKDRLLKVSMASFCLSTLRPISNMDRKFTMTLICNELLLYHKAFGFEQQFVMDILKDDDIRQNLNASSIVEIQPADQAMCKFVQKELRKLETLEARKSPNDLIIPLIESVVSMWPAERDTFRLLNQVLDGCRDDAKLLYLHQIIVDDLSVYYRHGITKNGSAPGSLERSNTRVSRPTTIMKTTSWNEYFHMLASTTQSGVFFTTESHHFVVPNNNPSSNTSTGTTARPAVSVSNVSLASGSSPLVPVPMKE